MVQGLTIHRADETQLLINNIKDSITSHFNEFEAWRHKAESENPTVISVEAKHEIQQPSHQPAL